MKNVSEAPVKKERICRKALPPGVAKVLKRLHFPVDVILLWALVQIAEVVEQDGFDRMPH
ncbi:hypothetical protein AYM40_36190 (plasmid) [Paraburkholderia phytofirmans OLGA172]|uniref:Uncharacterized protein n=1 Tax=Paraburkholderia phytofirmans OLGA172 TaxID=1417228 RepID=A0A160FX04_9BURK|nr:hypothetical protein [Paraburkholderia phytofirmans]ANB77802.1 hypothetical protein AYM40_36190 [Paraburkholderia phytofirmans OLGA172]